MPDSVQMFEGLRFDVTFKQDELPQVQGRPAPKHARSFIAWCCPMDQGKRDWVAHVVEVTLEERGDAESGPLGLDESWEGFDRLHLVAPMPATTGGVKEALLKEMHRALYEELWSDDEGSKR